MEKEKVVTFFAVIVLALAGCDISPSGISDEGVTVRSGLGFLVIATSDFATAGGSATQQHADLADQWWNELMRDLESADMDHAGAGTLPGSVRIYLHQPLYEDSLFNDDSGRVVGGWYSPNSGIMHVPGDYIDPDGMLGARPALQPIKHESLHHWCYQTMGHLCLKDEDLNGNNILDVGEDLNGNRKLDEDVHVWFSPNGTNIWSLTWQ